MIKDHNAILPPGYLPTANQVAVTVDGVPLRVVRYQHFDVPICFVHASLPEAVEHEVAVSVRRYQSWCRVYPDRLGVGRLSPEKKAKKPVAFRIRGNPYAVFESDGLGYLVLAFDPLQPEPAGDAVLNAAELGIRPDPDRVQTAALQAALDRVSADPQRDTLLLPAGLYRSGDLRLSANCRLHLASGAVLKASDHARDIGDPALPGWDRKRACFISATGAENIAITGHGHLDGNRAVLDLDRYYRQMIALTGCRNVRLEGPVFSDPCNWNTHLRDCEDVLARRLKILNNRPLMVCINTDGINPDSCRRVAIEQCVMHTGDDAVAVKSSDRGDGPPPDVADITVTDLLAINNSTTAKIGTETCAAVMERIRFERIDAVRTARLCVIDAFDRAHVREVVFNDCRVHQLDTLRADSVATGYVIELQAPAQAWRPIAAQGKISGVTLTDIVSDTPGRCAVRGQSDERGVVDVSLERVQFGGMPLTPTDIECGPHALNLRVDGVAIAADATQGEG